MARPRETHPSPSPGEADALRSGHMVLAWPGGGAGPAMVRPRPNLARAGLAIGGAVPLPGAHAPRGFGLRYWNAAEALARAAAVWQVAMGLDGARAELPWRWHCGATLPVHLATGPLAHAVYDRAGLHLVAPASAVADSPALLARVIGHAALDALRPDLWHAASDEVADFHAVFADLTAGFAALALPERRAALLAGGPGALAALLPQPDDHPGAGGFVRAMRDMVAALVRAEAGRRGRTPETALCGAAHRAVLLLVTAVRRVPVAPNFLAQLAAELALAARVQEGPDFAAQLGALFAVRRVLAPVAVAYNPHEADDGTEIPPDPPAELPMVAIGAVLGGLDQPLRLHPATAAPRIAVAALGRDGAPVDPPHPVVAARHFAAALFAAGRVAPPWPARPRRGSTATHRLVADGRTLRLCRTGFVCAPQALSVQPASGSIG